MGLASALSTALTGLTAAETQIDVVGNNLANSQTVGFKASETVFATQFLQTLSLGSSPTGNTGGTNPRQTGLGTQVAEISPDFTQGTIELSSNPSNLAIQGDGFFVVEGAAGETLYTRNGLFDTNAQNELVTATGQRVLGFGVDDTFQLVETQLVPLSIPLGSEAVAQATQQVQLEGVLTPTGDVATTAEVLQSNVLGNGFVPRPDNTGIGSYNSVPPNINATAISETSVGSGTLIGGDTYSYRFAFADSAGTESLASTALTRTITPTSGNNAIDLTNLPSSAEYPTINIYRTAAGDNDFFFLDSVPQGTTSFTDDGSIPLSATRLDESTINGNYSYLVTFFRAGAGESRPSPLIGPQNVVNGRVHLTNLPTPPVPPPGGGFPAYDQVRVYRNLASNANSFYLVDTLDPGASYTDLRSDAAISDLTNPSNQLVDLDGPKVDPNTLLTDVVRRDEFNYEKIFQEGTLSFTPRKGGRALTTKNFDITSASTVQDLVDFMEGASGIQQDSGDAANPIPGSINEIPGETGTLSPGGMVQDGAVRFVSNNGEANAIDFALSSFSLTTDTGEVTIPNLGFGSIQSATGQGAVADLVAYDSLGVPIDVRVTSVLEQRSASSTVYRWLADSGANDPVTGSEIAAGTGLIVFDGEGNLVEVTNDTVSIDRRNIPSNSPLQFELDFTAVSGLAADGARLAAARQDGSAPGNLASFIIGEGGTIRGVFSNGVTRSLGRVRLARFANPSGLEQRGQNLFGLGVNSGLPVEGNPSDAGLGTLVAGAVELSNTDIGANLVDLILATTQYRGNTRVITAAQQLLDELLNLRR